MDVDSSRELRAIVESARGLVGSELNAFLQEACRDSAHQLRVREALAAEAKTKSVAADSNSDEPSVEPNRAAPVITGYEIINEIHRGGQGVVYQAVQQKTKRKVAIKVLLDGTHASRAGRRRFQREIELVAQLKHPNIVAVFHSDETEEGRQYCVMDYVRGVSLDRYVREKNFNLAELLTLFAKICDAVNYAHRKGVIHRDLKPGNILVDNEGEPKVLDFGLAKQIINREATVLSLTGHVVGTLPYMSPEQAEGNPDDIDVRTDVYSLGVILYEMITGSFPYPVSGHIREILKHIAETPPAPPTRTWNLKSGVKAHGTKKLRSGTCPIDDEIQTIVLRTLAKERDRRYQTAGNLAEDVRRYLGGEAIEAKRDSGWYVIRKVLQKKRAPVLVVSSILIMALAFGVLYVKYADMSSDFQPYFKKASQFDIARSQLDSAKRDAASNAELVTEIAKIAYAASPPPSTVAKKLDRIFRNRAEFDLFIGHDRIIDLSDFYMSDSDELEPGTRVGVTATVPFGSQVVLLHLNDEGTGTFRRLNTVQYGNLPLATLEEGETDGAVEIGDHSSEMLVILASDHAISDEALEEISQLRCKTRIPHSPSYANLQMEYTLSTLEVRDLFSFAQKHDAFGSIFAFNISKEKKIVDPDYYVFSHELSKAAKHLLTIEDDTARDPQLALTLAEIANAKTDSEIPEFLTTLALAYFETGANDEAIATQEKAIALYDRFYTIPNNRDRLIRRLERFKAAGPAESAESQSASKDIVTQD